MRKEKNGFFRKVYICFLFSMFGVVCCPHSSKADTEIDLIRNDLSISFQFPQQVFALDPADSRDLDKDGLVDDAENRIAREFFPVLLFDGDEAFVQGSYNEPHTLFQVTPRTSGESDVYTGKNLIRVTYQFTFSDDGGWGSCTSIVASHSGDNDKIWLYFYFNQTDNRVYFLYAKVKTMHDNDQYMCNFVSDASIGPCTIGRARSYWTDTRDDSNRDDGDWFSDSAFFWENIHGVYTPGWHEKHMALFFSENKHHIYLHRWKKCYEAWNWEVQSKQEKANGNKYDLDYFEDSMAESLNVGEYHSKDFVYPESTIMAGDAYFTGYYDDVADWNHASAWEDEHFWNTEDFINNDGKTSPLSKVWSKASPWNADVVICPVRTSLDEDPVPTVCGASSCNCYFFGMMELCGCEEAPGFDFDGDGITEREGLTTWEEWLDEWETAPWDKCPMGSYGTIEEETSDADGDGWGDACDLCPNLSNTPHPNDIDWDGRNNPYDNCPCDSNSKQEDCDGDYIGDACDTDRCVDFEKAVQSVVCTEGPLFLYCYSPEMPKVEYRTDGNGNLFWDLHDAQFRWCDCRNPDYNMFDPWSGDEYYNDDDCILFNCHRDNLANEINVHFDHERWHMASVDHATTPSGGDSATAWPNLEEGFAPRTDCGSAQDSTTWTATGRDADVTSLWTKHCGPQRADFSAIGTSSKHKVYWDWQWELWWRHVQPEDRAPFLTPNTDPIFALSGGGEKIGRAHFWLRPEWSDSAGLPIDGSLNKYNEASLINPKRAFKPIVATDVFGKYYIYTGCPYRYDRVGNPVRDFGLEATLPQLNGGYRVALGAIALGAGMSTKFAYSSGIAGNDAAIGGLVHVFVSESSLEAGAVAYATSDSMGGVPNTVGFGVADFGVQGTNQNVATAEPAGVAVAEPKHLIAAFGGTLGSGALSDRLWIGAFGGLDADGEPFFSWRDATPVNADRPTARTGAALLFDSFNERLLLLGGQDAEGDIADDIWAFDMNAEVWAMSDTPHAAPRLVGAVAIPFGASAFIVGGRTERGEENTTVYHYDLIDGRFTEVGDLGAGPGARAGAGYDIALEGSPRLFVSGGRDDQGLMHSDVWELDLRTARWKMVKPDCTGRCPVRSVLDVLMVDDAGESFALYTGDDPDSRMFFKSGTGDTAWLTGFELHPMPTTIDCDGDGALDPEASKACRSQNAWYAPVGVAGCPHPETGAVSCSTPRVSPMETLADWSPRGWEWIVSFEVADEVAYVLTDRAVYTFDLTSRSGDELVPASSVAFTLPEMCGWPAIPDTAFSMELKGDLLYVGTWSGMRVLDLSDSLHPTEIARLDTWAPVLDLVVLGKAVYLADGSGITVVDVSSPGAPVEAGYKTLDRPVLRLEVEEATWSLLALTTRSFVKMRLSNPARPTETSRVSVSGLLFSDMETEGHWTYLNGLTTQSVWDGPNGLEKRGPHDVRDWVEGRVEDGDVAYRVRRLANAFEMWREQ